MKIAPTPIVLVVLALLLALSQAAQAAPLIAYRSAGWKYRLGTTEASNPTDAWRARDFDDSSWSTGAAPIGYPSSDAGVLEASIQTTLPTSATGGYTCVFLRKTFVITNLSDFVKLSLSFQHDDGFAAWINGTEIGRSANVAAGTLSISTLPTVDHEVTTGETALELASLAGVVVEGTNVLAVQLFNVGTTSSDLFLDATLSGVPDDPPTLLAVDPAPASIVLELGFIDITFTENVTGVDAADLLINNVASVTNVQQVSPREYVFQFPQPPTGSVSVAWAANPGIVDQDGGPNAFVPGPSWSYTLDPNASPSYAFISEFMADNANGIRDEDGDRRDWIELYNPGPIDLNLGGWYLTDVATNLTKWRFPAVNLAANRYMIVWASEKNKTNPAAPLHTSFRLGKDAGGYLALVTPGLTVASAFASYPAQSPDVSYGRDRVDPNLVGYYTNSTPGVPVNGIYPGAQNSTSGTGFADEPVFSHESGIYTNDSITLTITAPAGVTVRYTLDGSEPTAASTAYTAPIVFTTNMMIKARGFSSTPGLWPSPVVARTFVMLDNTTRGFNSNLPILIISTHGRPVDQQTTVTFQRTKGTFISIDTFRGRSALTDKTDFQGLGAFEIVGQTSAGFEKKPVRIELNDEIGNDLNASVLGLPADADWNLRNPHNDKTFLNDYLGYELWEQLGHYSCRRRLVELFFDTGGGKLSYPGDYYGIMVLFEHLEAGKDRVDVAKLSPAITNEPGITGGYIIKKDKDSVGDTSFTTTGGGTPAHSGQTLKFHEPKPREISVTQSNYIRNYVNRFEASMFAANWTNATGTNHYSYYIDVDTFVDQHLHVEFTKQIDGYRLSSFYSKDRNGKLKPDPVWDWNLAFGNANYLQGGKTNGWYWNNEAEGMNSSTHIWLRRLIYGLPSISAVAPNTSANGPGDPDFRQKITDRWSVVRNDVLNGDRLLAHIDELSSYLTEAAARNYAKYPTLLNTYQWPNPEGPPAWDVDYTQTSYAAIISEMKKWTKGRYVWMDSQFLGTPAFDRSEGNILPGSQVVIAASQGTIYYTTDGTDPRLPGGGISPAAQIYTAPLVLNDNTRLVARAYVNPTPLWTPWSAPAAATYVVQTPKLVITEIMYHPAPSPLPAYTEEDFEYLEVQNVDATPLNVNNYTISGGIDFTFGNLLLAPGQRVVVVKNQAAFTALYGAGATIAGQYTGSLANEGNRLILQGRLREPILDFRYDDQWYPITDGFGFSLVIVNANAAASTWGDKQSWRPSGVVGGTPGQADGPSPSFPQVVINEALTHSDPAPPTDTIELNNLGGTDANVGGWYLTDDFRTPKKYRIPAGRTIPAGGRITFDESNFNVPGNPDGNIPFALSSNGDELYLFAANASGDLTGYYHGFSFEAQRHDVTFGRYVTASGEEHFVAQSSPTLGAPNAGPLIGPIVISEIMYRPQDVLANGAYWNDTEDEYIELHNISGAAVTLADDARPTNTWKLDKAVEFKFAPGTAIPAGGYLVVVNFDPVGQAAQATAFRAKYGISQSVALVGPYKGSLDNSEGNVSLYLPDTPNTNGTVPYVVVDRVHYHDSFPWPTDADGLGQSLQRLNDNAFGNDWGNWVAGGPTPGSGFSTGPAPTVITQPNSAVVGDSGTASASFSCTAIGPGPLRYQWLFNGSALSGATSGTLTLQNIKASQAGEYRCVVLNPFGSAVSAPATLTVLVLPKITQHPGSQKVTPGANVSMAVIATSINPPLRYQWFRDGYVIPSATNSFYSLVNVQDTEEGNYYVVLTDGNGSVTSGTAELKVLLRPEVLQPVPPMRVTAVAGETVTLGVQTRGTKPMLYRWRRVLSTGAALILTNRTLNANADFLVLPNVQTNLNNSYFLIILTNEMYTAQNLAFTNAYLSVLDDSNSNGIPDNWEATYFGSPTGADRDADSDGDGMSNYAEYIAGTDPTNASSYLRADITASGLATILFPAVSNRTYTVEYRDGLDAGPWNRLADVVSRSVNWNATVTDRGATTNRFYRLATPKK